MRVYVLGDDHGPVVKVANFINSLGHTAIISEAAPTGYEDIVKDMLDNHSYDYDLTVALAKGPVELSVSINRNGKFASAVCRDAQESAMARKARANVLVLDSNGFDPDDAGGIVEAWLGSPEPRPQAAAQMPAPRKAGRSGMAAQLLSLTGIQPGQKKHKKEPRREERQEDAEDDAPRPKGKGIINSIKYTFGLE